MNVFLRLLNFFCLLFCCSMAIVNAQNYKIDWVNSLGTSSDEYAAATVVVDDNGFSYYIGTHNAYVSDTIDVDPSLDTFHFFERTNFISKFDPFGNFVWSKSIPYDPPFDAFNRQSISLDKTGNILITGRFTATYDFDPGQQVYNVSSNGQEDIFILKLSAAGDFLSVKSFGGTGSESIRSICVDYSGNIILAGLSYSDSVDFDPGPGINKQNVANSVGYILKLDNAENFAWVKLFTGTPGSSAYVTDLAIDSGNNILFSGCFLSGDVDFDPGDEENILSGNFGEGYVTKLDSMGDFEWARAFNGTFVFLSAISVDRTGNSYISGEFSENMDADPGLSANMLTCGLTEGDVFILKLNKDGIFMWAKQFGGDTYDIARNNHCDANGNIYVVGSYMNLDNHLYEADLDPNIGIYTLGNPVGEVYQYLTILDSTGNFVWAGSFGGTSIGVFDEHRLGVDVTADGEVYISGEYNDSRELGMAATIDFDFGPETFNIDYKGGKDIFLLKLNRCFINSDTISTLTCDSFSFKGQTYTQSGIYSIVPSGMPGKCDSLFILNLNLGSTTKDTLAITGCDSFTFNGQTYISDGFYTQSFISPKGCDSTIVIDLSINGNTPDTMVIQSGTTLTSLAVASSYQWIDCGNGNIPIAGETNSSYTPATNGQYAVVVTGSGGCSDTSSCYNVMVTNIQSLDSKNEVHTYPNPVMSTLHISSKRLLYGAALRVFNITGQLLWFQQDIYGYDFSVDMHEYLPGIYFLEISDGNDDYRIKLIKD